MIGIIHFMDVWNIDLDQVQRCVIHYATPDGEVRPFCIQQHPPNNVEKAKRASLKDRGEG